MKPTRYFSVVLLLLSAAGSASAETVRVAVASNFVETLRTLEAEFAARHSDTLLISSASTGKHYAQIVRGAPFDVFLAADAIRPARLGREGHAVAATRFTYAIGQLMLWSRDPSRYPVNLERLAQDEALIALANPRFAPYGVAAVEVLERLGVYAQLRAHGRLVLGENISQTYQFVHTGGADYGFVAHAQRPPAAQSTPVPANWHAPIDQQAIALNEHPATLRFMVFLKSDAARRIIRNDGYRVP